MPAGSTYTPIATTTWTSNTATISFGSIPSTYTDLVIQGTIFAYFGSSTYTEGRIRFNGDSSTNYSATVIYGDGSSVTSARGSNQTGINRFYLPAGTTDGNRGSLIVNIQNYSNTTTNKTALIRSGGGTQVTDATVGMWRSTSAITSIDITNADSATGFVAGTLTLYGIASA